ncbi:T-complex protein 11-domain-containing protein [Sporodiniella umbellata]|nr:T-complex protein 11-domain-containing protein [Sporodiniella umbellata]
MSQGEQTVKKKARWSAVLKVFEELQLPLPSCPETWLEFNRLSELLHQPKVIVITTKILNTGLKRIDGESRHRALVLLTAYMIFMCPEEILQHIDQDQQEKELHQSAREMLYGFEGWYKIHRHPGATKAREIFMKSWEDYYGRFERWKSQDQAELVDNLIAYYVQLSTLRQTLLGEEQTESLEVQLAEAKQRLECWGGSEALQKLQSALERSRASTSSGIRQQQEERQPRHPVADNAPVKKDQVNTLLENHDSRLTNLQLVHELVLEPQFDLKNYADPLEVQVKAIARKAFFDRLEQEIAEGKMALCLPDLIEEMKQRLLSMVPEKSAMAERLSEDLDRTLIEQQMKKGVFDIDLTLTYFTQRMGELCAPVRDSEIEWIQAQEQPMTRLRAIAKVLEAMAMDLSNFRLRRLRRPLMASVAVDYERERFAEMLGTGQIQLVKTEHWLGCFKEKEHVFEEAFVSLLSQAERLTAQGLPETLALDVRRMADYQNTFQANALVATLLTLTRNFGPTLKAQTLAELGVRFFQLLEDPTTMVENLAMEIERAVSPTGATQTVIRNMVDKTLSHTDPVYAILSRRVGTVVKSVLVERRWTHEVVAGQGLDFIQPSLQLFAQNVLKFVNYHRKIYEDSWYCV